MKTKPSLLLSLVITLLIAANFYIISYIDKAERAVVIIERIIDGDTLVLDSGETIRLENINTPERSEYGYEEAKYFLTQFENQTVEIEKTGIDKYGRTLAKLYTHDYLNLEIVKNGFAKKYLVDDSEAKLFAEAEKYAIEKEIGLWKKSEFFGCIDSEISVKQKIIVLKNSCIINFDNFKLSDESRKSFNFPNLSFTNLNIRLKEGKTNETDFFITESMLNTERDTLYIFDSNNALAHYHSYGY